MYIINSPNLRSYRKPIPEFYQVNTLHTRSSSLNINCLTSLLWFFNKNKNTICQTQVSKHQILFVYNCLYSWCHSKPCKLQATPVKSMNNLRLIARRREVTCLPSCDTSSTISEVFTNSGGIVLFFSTFNSLIHGDLVISFKRCFKHMLQMYLMIACGEIALRCMPQNILNDIRQDWFR